MDDSCDLCKLSSQSVSQSVSLLVCCLSICHVPCAVPARVLREVSLDEVLSLEAGCAHLLPSSSTRPAVIRPFSGTSLYCIVSTNISLLSSIAGCCHPQPLSVWCESLTSLVQTKMIERQTTINETSVTAARYDVRATVKQSTSTCLSVNWTCSLYVCTKVKC